MTISQSIGDLQRNPVTSGVFRPTAAKASMLRAGKADRLAGGRQPIGVYEA